MARVTDEQIAKDKQAVVNYLRSEYLKKMTQDQAKDRLEKFGKKMAKRLGMGSHFNVLTGNLPGAKLANFTASYLKYFYFEGYFSSNPGLNPYDPITTESEYIEYLLYSWARGKPAYKYNDLKAYF